MHSPPFGTGVLAGVAVAVRVGVIDGLAEGVVVGVADGVNVGRHEFALMQTLLATGVPCRLMHSDSVMFWHMALPSEPTRQQTKGTQAHPCGVVLQTVNGIPIHSPDVHCCSVGTHSVVPAEAGASPNPTGVKPTITAANTTRVHCCAAMSDLLVRWADSASA
jgi:hypothetical protein